MPTKTTNYGLVKPTPEEYYNVEIQNANMDIIDTQIKVDADNISALNTSLSTEITNRQNADALKLDKAGGTMTGAVNLYTGSTVNGNLIYHKGNITHGTAAPSGGSDGDVYLQYT